MKKSKKPAYTAPNDKIKGHQWILIGYVMVFLFIFPFKTALFNGHMTVFDHPIYQALLLCSFALAATSYSLFSRRKEDHQQGMMLFVWLLPLSYTISLFNAASFNSAYLLILLHVMYALFFILGILILRNRLGSALIQGSIMGSGFLIVLFGFMNWFGDASFFGLKTYVGGSQVYNDAVMTDGVSWRLTSVFQYANTYAAYLIGLLISSLFLTVWLRNKYLQWSTAFMLVPIIVSFMLTLSRGGLVILPFVLLIILLFLPMVKQILILLHLACAAVISLIILGPVTKAGIDIYELGATTPSYSGWGILLVASAGSASLSLLLQLYAAPLVERMTTRFRFRLSNVFLPATFVVIGSVAAVILFTSSSVQSLFPESIQQRLANINLNQHSVLERGTFYKDSMKLFGENPLIGAGGGAWAATYEKYQSNPYTSRQAHNFLLQYLVEIGAVGMLILVLFICTIFYLYIRHCLKNQDYKERTFIGFIFAAALIIHSIIDFNLSYAYLAALLFLCFGILLSGVEFKLPGWFTKPAVQNWTRIGHPSLIGLLSVFIFFQSIQLLNAHSHYNQSIDKLREQRPIQEALQLLDKAIRIAPYHPIYSVQKISLLTYAYEHTGEDSYYEEAMKLLRTASKYTSSDAALLDLEYQLLMMKGNYADALETVSRGVDYFPWDAGLYDRKIALLVELGNQARDAGDTVKANQLMDEAILLLEEVLRRIQLLEELPEAQLAGRAFYVTTSMALNVGQIYYIRGNTEEAVDLLRQSFTPQMSEPLEQVGARWYLAALQKLGRSDQAAYDRLIALDPEERQRVDELARSTF